MQNLHYILIVEPIRKGSLPNRSRELLLSIRIQGSWANAFSNPLCGFSAISCKIRLLCSVFFIALPCFLWNLNNRLLFVPLQLWKQSDYGLTTNPARSDENKVSYLVGNSTELYCCLLAFENDCYLNWDTNRLRQKWKSLFGEGSARSIGVRLKWVCSKYSLT